jgi:hypothetical protein
MFGIVDKIHDMQDSIGSAMKSTNLQLDKEIRLQRDTKKDLQRDLLKKRDDLE